MIGVSGEIPGVKPVAEPLSASLAGDAPHEPVHVDHEADVCALTDTLVFVVGLDPKHQRRPSRSARVARKVTRMPIGVAAR